MSLFYNNRELLERRPKRVISRETIPYPNGVKELLLTFDDQTRISFIANGPAAEALSSDSDQLKRPSDLGGVARQTLYLRDEQYKVLSQPWELLSRLGVPVLGTPDHHGLLLHLVESGDSSPADVLLNFDTHHDVWYSDQPIDPGLQTVRKGNFVAAGFAQHLQKVWDHYILVAHTDDVLQGVEKLQGKGIMFERLRLLDACSAALEQAKQSNSKIILTIDYDYFGSRDGIDFDPVEAAQDLQDIFQFVRENRDFIRLVHCAESVEFCADGNAQVSQLNEMLSSLLEQI